MKGAKGWKELSEGQKVLHEKMILCFEGMMFIIVSQFVVIIAMEQLIQFTAKMNETEYI